MIRLLENIHYSSKEMLHVFHRHHLCYDDWVWLYVFIINSYFPGAYKYALGYKILIPGAFLLQIGRKK